METRRTPDPKTSEAGFMLVGVVMFVIVLTILGLSLFSLSGFEAQFLNASIRRTESFYSASSAIERAKFVLLSDQPLYNVRNNRPPNVTYCKAKQGASWDGPDSTNMTLKIDWSPAAPPVWIRAIADVRGEKRMLEQRFDPSRPNDMYRRLFTLSGTPSMRVSSVDMSDPPPRPNRSMQTWIAGNLWLAQACPDPYFTVPGFQPPTIGGVPPPDVDGYMTQHWGTAQNINLNQSGNHRYNFNPPGSAAKFYRTRWNGTADWGLFSDGSRKTQINVQGKVIWMFDHGVKFQDRVDITGSQNPGPSPTDLLVIVAKEGGPPTERMGIAFGGSLQSSIPVILVSDSRVGIEHDWNGGESSSTYYLSVYADNLLLLGPRPNNTMVLSHLTNAIPEQLNGVVTALMNLGLLPNTQPGVAGTLTPLAGTWQELGTN